MRPHPLRPDENTLPGFRSGSPKTSVSGAFDAYPRSGSQRWKALLAVVEMRNSGATYADVEQITRIRGVWKRLSELKQGGWIEVIGQRMIKETGSAADVYRATDKAIKFITEKEGLS